MKKILILLIGILSLIFLVIGLIVGGLGLLDRGGPLAKATGGGACINNGNISISYVSSDYMPFVKDAAQKYLKGDSLALIAVIKIESNWNPKAANSQSSATGLAQFITSTAKGYAEYVGGIDATGKSWPTGQVFDNPQSHPEDSRFDAERSIYAAAHYLSNGMEKSNNDLFTAYAQYYHTYGDTADTKSAAVNAGNKVVAEYNKLKASVGSACASASGSSIISIAHQQLGIAENPLGSDSGPAIQKFLGSSKGEKWCADFVSWVYNQAGTPLTGGSDGGWRIAGAAALYNYFQAHGIVNTPDKASSNPPQPGDIIYLNYNGQDHVGIVESVAGNILTMISGNTSANKVGEDTLNYTTNSNLIGWGRLR